MSDLGQVAYDAYSTAVGGLSRFTGDRLPAYAEQAEEIRVAWQHAALMVRQEVDTHTERGLAGQSLAVAPIDYPKTWGHDAKEAERRHRERMANLDVGAARTEAYAEGERAVRAEADIRVDAAYQRGWTAGHSALDIREHQDLKAAYVAAYARGRADREREIGRAQAEVIPIASELVSEVGPTHYELWRDAWNLTVASSAPDYNPHEMQENAEWFLARLKAGSPGPSVPDCLHCGSDSSRVHEEGCPNEPEPEDPVEHDEHVIEDDGTCKPCGGPVTDFVEVGDTELLQRLDEGERP